MKPKKGKPVKKYSVGGAIAAQVGLMGLQSLLAGSQWVGGTAMANKLKAPSTATPSAWKDFFESAQNQAITQKNIDELNRIAATSLSALQAGGSEALAAGVQPLAQQTQQATQDIYNQQILREMQAAGQLGAAEERAINRERDVYETRLGEAQAARAAGIQNMFNALGSAGKAITDLTSIKKETLTPSGLREARRIDNINPKEVASVLESPDSGVIQRALPFSLPPSKSILSLPEYSEEERRFKLPSELKDGGMMTGGKFSHKTNPIDILQKGKKIGEMTGGEVILNPAQQKKLSKESEYFRQLLKKFNKQK